MAIAVSEAVLGKINVAEQDLVDAQAADASHTSTVGALNTAQANEQAATAAATAAHQKATASALDALAALRAELGLPATP